jgi:predicted aspartyl protease
MRCAVRLFVLPATIALLAAGTTDRLAEVAIANGHAAAVHFHAIGERFIEGRHERITVDQEGVRRLTRICIADACVGTWFDGRRLATFGLNDVVMPQDDDPATPARRTLAAIESYAFAEPGFRDGGGTADELAPQVWRVRAVDGATLFAQLDPRTGALIRVAQADGTVIEAFADTVRAAGAAFARSQTGLDDIAVDAVTADTTPLSAPDGASATFSGDATAALRGDDVPIVDCRIAGIHARCLLDSGATPSAIALPLAETLGLEPRGELEITGFSRFATGFVEPGLLVVGAAHFTGLRLAVIPAVTGARFDVVVGADLLYRLGIVIDRAHRLARIDAPGREPPLGGAPLTFADGVPEIQAALDGVPSAALLDTGDASIVSLGYADYRRGPQWPIVDRSLASGVGGAADAFAVTIPGVAFGGETFGPTRAEVGRTQAGVHVGIGVWSTCTVELDESQRRFGCVRTP